MKYEKENLVNIKEAKEQIKNAMIAYFTKDKFGNYVIPVEKQRPVFLMGPPGIGKTAIMEQIASEMGVGLLSYSMTHHTRQSALGLPVIVHKEYDGKPYDVSEYTMSEIISSVYDLMETTGVKEGILFLDEINCVSETLAPIMLQFLQYKVFGRHRVPNGWIVVTAGNPPEYNNSVREFDIVTWDRLKRIDCEPDFAVWKEYAYYAGVHPGIMAYLEIKKSDFYVVQSTVDGKSFVTARGWEDLSQMILLYEQNEIKVDEKLIGQYLQNERISRSFSNYYDLFNKYKSDYQIGSILKGEASEEIKKRAKAAKFDERLSLIGLMLNVSCNEVKEVMLMNRVIEILIEDLKLYRQTVVSTKDPYELLKEFLSEHQWDISIGRKANNLSTDELYVLQQLVDILEEETKLIQGENSPDKAFGTVKENFDEQIASLRRQAETAKASLNNMFLFSEEVFGREQEMVIIVAEITANKYCSKFISKFGCEEYFKHNEELLFYERDLEIDKALEELKL